MPICRLCHKDRILRKSHIVPEFLYSHLYNEKGHMMGINGIGAKGWKPLQQGIREHLFCEECEQHFNEHFEKPFRQQWVVNCPLPDPWNVPEPHWISVSYATFKLFHLSVLFRASVSSLPTYSEAVLGIHEERLRQMIWTKNPGEALEYPIWGLALVHHQTSKIVQLVSQVQRGRFAGQRCYAICYGGMQWWIGVNSHRNSELEAICLQKDGRIPVSTINWRELGLIQSASRLLCKN